jgi:hypothetical protein
MSSLETTQVVPTTQAPTTQAPTTQAPTTQAPTTQAPTTQAPTTQAPVPQDSENKKPLNITQIVLIIIIFFIVVLILIGIFINSYNILNISSILGAIMTFSSLVLFIVTIYLNNENEYTFIPYIVQIILAIVFAIIGGCITSVIFDKVHKLELLKKEALKTLANALETNV